MPGSKKKSERRDPKLVWRGYNRSDPRYKVYGPLSGQGEMEKPVTESEVKIEMARAVETLFCGLEGKKITPGRWLKIIIGTAMVLKRRINCYGLVLEGGK